MKSHFDQLAAKIVITVPDLCTITPDHLALRALMNRIKWRSIYKDKYEETAREKVNDANAVLKTEHNRICVLSKLLDKAKRRHNKYVKIRAENLLRFSYTFEQDTINTERLTTFKNPGYTQDIFAHVMSFLFMNDMIGLSATCKGLFRMVRTFKWHNLDVRYCSAERVSALLEMYDVKSLNLLNCDADKDGVTNLLKLARIASVSYHRTEDIGINYSKCIDISVTVDIRQLPDLILSFNPDILLKLHIALAVPVPDLKVYDWMFERINQCSKIVQLAIEVLSGRVSVFTSRLHLLTGKLRKVLIFNQETFGTPESVCVNQTIDELIISTDPRDLKTFDKVQLWCSLNTVKSVHLMCEKAQHFLSSPRSGQSMVTALTVTQPVDIVDRDEIRSIFICMHIMNSVNATVRDGQVVFKLQKQPNG
jgi:hypothetical protein